VVDAVLGSKPVLFLVFDEQRCNCEPERWDDFGVVEGRARLFKLCSNAPTQVAVKLRHE